MADQLLITPSGRIAIRQSTEESSSLPALAPSMAQAVRTLGSSQSEGLFALATLASDSSLPPDLVFWRDFACQYLTQLCLTPESSGRRVEPIEIQKLFAYNKRL